MTNERVVAVVAKITAGEALKGRDADLAIKMPKVIGKIVRLTQKSLSQVTEPVAGIDRTLFYKSREWREVRYKALKRSAARCEACGRSPHDGIVLHVDHVKPFSKFPELRLSLQNLQVLCEDCNLGKGAWDDTDWRGPMLVVNNVSKAQAS